MIAAVLALPFSPTLLANIAGAALLGLTFLLIMAIGAIQIGRRGAFQYLLIRFAVRDGLRAARKRSPW